MLAVSGELLQVAMVLLAVGVAAASGNCGPPTGAISGVIGEGQGRSG